MTVGPEHWDSAYRDHAEHSWDETIPQISLAMLDAAGVPAHSSVIDVGGGASPLAGALLDRGHTDVTVVDISAEALHQQAARLGPRAGKVATEQHDVTDWRPARTWQVWHDRAVFHFLTDISERDRYGASLLTAIPFGGIVVIGTFAPDGPERCSGLLVQRYAAPGIVAALPPVFSLVATLDHLHHTPWGAAQPFTWVALRRTA